MADTISPNMNLAIPGVGTAAGPDYANSINADLNILDIHDHSPGFGVPITPTGISINADLPFANNNLTGARSLRLQPQTVALGTASDIGCLYAVTATSDGSDLWFNTGNGTQIQITKDGALFGVGNGSISGLVAPASASYNAISSTFVWQSNTNTPANLDAGFLILRNNTASSKGLTLSPPAAMAANYSITLPTLPASTSFVTLDSSGNLAASYTTAQVLTATRFNASGQPGGPTPISGTVTFIPPTVNVDTASGYNAVTGLYTIPTTGNYDVAVGFGFDTTSVFEYTVELVKNGSTTIYRQKTLSTVNFWSFNFSVSSIPLTASDTLQVNITNGGASGGNWAPAANNWFSLRS